MDFGPLQPNINERRDQDKDVITLVYDRPPDTYLNMPGSYILVLVRDLPPKESG